MTALAQRRVRRAVAVNQLVGPLAEGYTGFEGGMACAGVDGKIYPGRSASNLTPLGTFNDSTDAVGADVPVRVRLPRERVADWWMNDTGSPVNATHLFRSCYVLDDQTVTSDSTGRSVAGRVLQIDPIKGVLVEWP